MPGCRDAKPEDLNGGDARGECRPYPRRARRETKVRYRDIVLLNAGGALMVAGQAKTLSEGVALAAQSIDSGKAKAVLEALVQLSHDKV